MGRVCAKHNEFYEMRCRWCEPSQVMPWKQYAAPVIISGPQSPTDRTFLQAIEARITAMEHSRTALRNYIASIHPDLSESTLDRHGGCE